MLLSAIVHFDLLLGNVLFSQELGLVLQAGQHDFVSTQMHHGVGEDVEDLGEDLLD